LREAMRQNPGPFGITLSGQGASGDENLQRIAQALGVSVDRLTQAIQQTMPVPEGGAMYIGPPGSGPSGWGGGVAVGNGPQDGWPQPPPNGYGPAHYPPSPAPGWPSTWR